MFSLQKLQRRLLAYLFSNTFIVLIAIQGFLKVESQASGNLFAQGAAWHLASVFRMYICVVFFEWILSKRKRIHERDSTKEE